jgi:hypothetical protein
MKSGPKSVSAGEVGKRVVELLGINEGEIEIALTRDGHVLVGRTQP